MEFSIRWSDQLSYYKYFDARSKSESNFIVRRGISLEFLKYRANIMHIKYSINFGAIYKELQFEKSLNSQTRRSKML